MIPIIHINLTCYYSEQKIARGPRVSSQDESRPFGRSNPSASQLKSLPKAVVVMLFMLGWFLMLLWEGEGEQFVFPNSKL